MDILTHPTIYAKVAEYWKLDEASGNRVGAKNGIILTDAGGVAGVAGVADGGADFAGSILKKLYCSNANAGALNIGGDVSLHAWIKPASLSNRSVISKWHHSAGNQYRLDVGNTSHWATYASSCGGYAYNSPNGGGYSGGTYAVGTWYMVTWVADISARTSWYYVNGVLHTTQNSHQSSISNNCGAADFVLGGQDASTGHSFDGVISGAMVVDGILTQSEITDLYNGGAGIPWEAVASSNTKSILGVDQADIKSMLGKEVV